MFGPKDRKGNRLDVGDRVRAETKPDSFEEGTIRALGIPSSEILPYGRVKPVLVLNVRIERIE